jgi:hypothetical protein
VYTFRYKQSSLIGSGTALVTSPPRTWIDEGPKSRADRTPVHGSAGSGARKRSLPIGGFANGMPRNAM